MTSKPSAHAVNQYAATTGNLTARIALHAYGTKRSAARELIQAQITARGR